MPIADRDFKHGAALYQIAAHSGFKAINPGRRSLKGAFIINDDVGIYIKHATSQNSPWHFTFMPKHQELARRLFDEYEDRAYIVSVCGVDGICLLEYTEYATAVSPDYKSTKWLQVSRHAGSQYTIKGSAGTLPTKVAGSRYPEWVF